MHWFELAQELDLESLLRKGDLVNCISRVSKVLRDKPESPFHIVLQQKFTNNPDVLATHFDTFSTNSDSKYAALYAEMNGFDVNPDQWYFELFGYKHHGGHEHYNWLSAWDGHYTTHLPLVGMEDLQQVYRKAQKDTNTGIYTDAKEVADLLVVLRFQNLIQRCTRYLRHVYVPVLSTAHDYDLIYETPYNSLKNRA